MSGILQLDYMPYQNQLRLTISDQGTGFDAESAANKKMDWKAWSVCGSEFDW